MPTHLNFVFAMAILLFHADCEMGIDIGQKERWIVFLMTVIQLTSRAIRVDGEHYDF